MEGTTFVDSVAIGGLESITLVPAGGAGGIAHLPGNYRFGNHREPYREAGQWGLLRVHTRCAEGAIAPLPGSAGCLAGVATVTRSTPAILAIVVPSGAAAACGIGAWSIRRRRRR